VLMWTSASAAGSQFQRSGYSSGIAASGASAKRPKVD
jgi:hypothetical protein